MFRIGGHASIAGSVLNALKSFEEMGANTGQIFVHSPRVWKVPIIPEELAEQFRTENKNPLLVHASYLLNIASTSTKLYHGSINVIKQEIIQSAKLGIKHLCLHPGNNKNEQEGINQIIKACQKLLPTLEENNFKLCFENTSGGGGKRAYDFKEISKYFEELGTKHFGVVLDTQHTFAAGMDWRKLKTFKETIQSTIGFEKIEFIHLNDSKTELGSNYDRHEHIGKGKIGIQAFKELVNDPDFQKIPMICETPIEPNYGFKENITVVKNLIA